MSYGSSGESYGHRIQPLYAAGIHHARESGQLDQMKELAARGEEYLAADGDIAGALEQLKAEIAKLEDAEG